MHCTVRCSLIFLQNMWSNDYRYYNYPSDKKIEKINIDRGRVRQQSFRHETLCAASSASCCCRRWINIINNNLQLQTSSVPAGKVFERCEFARELVNHQGFARATVGNWVCLANVGVLSNAGEVCILKTTMLHSTSPATTPAPPTTTPTDPSTTGSSRWLIGMCLFPNLEHFLFWADQWWLLVRR